MMNLEHEVLETVEAERAFLEFVGQNPDVIGVWKFYRDDRLDLWAVVEGDLYQVERVVATAATSLLRSFPDINFDFMVVPLAGRRLDEIISPEGVLIYRRGE
jgi:hypothetical protein